MNKMKNISKEFDRIVQHFQLEPNEIYRWEEVDGRLLRHAWIEKVNSDNHIEVIEHVESIELYVYDLYSGTEETIIREYFYTAKNLVKYINELRN